jgi:glutamate decarboxylase
MSCAGDVTLDPAGDAVLHHGVHSLYFGTTSPRKQKQHRQRLFSTSALTYSWEDGETCSESHPTVLPTKTEDCKPKKVKDNRRQDEKESEEIPVTEPQHAASSSSSRPLSASLEPDWRQFERVYAKDLIPKRDFHEAGSSAKSRKDPLASDSYDQTVGFLVELVHMLLEHIRKSNDRSCKVLDFHHPHHLREMMGHCIDLHAEPQDLEQILSDCKETLKYCVKTGHPHFFNQLSTGLDVIAVAGEWLTAVTNTNMFTYEIAPVFTLLEDVVLTHMRQLVGWPDGTGDGIFAPGGAISNLYAVLVARHVAVPAVKTQGLRSLPPLIMFQSDQSHFSIKRAALILGIGTDNVISIRSDENGKMIPEELDAKITEAKANGFLPFFVSTTSGTTVLGAFDPLDAIADVCEKHGVWMHVDGAYGGSVLISKKHRHLMSGVHRANSVTWNPHKLLGVTLQCSAILLREKGHLEACNGLQASYLFQSDKQYDTSFDTGDKAIQCGRHNDIFKLWLMWRARGDIGFEAQIDHLMDMSHYLQKELVKREGFELVLEKPEFLNVSFWYIPQSMRCMQRGEEYDQLLHKVAPRIKAMMMEKGSMMVGYQPLGKLPNFFRVVLSNPALVPTDVDFFLDEIAKLGEDE